MEEKEREQLKERLLKMVVNEPRLESMPPITMAEVMINSMSKPNLEPLLDFISQELDKAREGGKFDRFELSYIKTLHSEARAYRKYMGVTLTEEGEKRDKDFISKLSKLTTK